MKRLLPIALALSLLFMLMLQVSGSSNRTAVTVVLNGQTVAFDTPAYIENGRTMVPLRAIAEALGLTVSWNNSSKTAYLSDGSAVPDLTGYLIAIDPGHGGSATGAVYSGVRESHLNLEIAKRTAAALESRGAKVLLTRTSDKDVPLTERTRLAKEKGADLFISIHCNSSVTNPKATGIYTAYYPGSSDSLRLADTLRSAMMAAAGAGDMGTHGRADLAVLRTASMGAALVECGFMSTPEELSLLREESHQEKLAQGIADGVTAYFWA